MELAEQIFERVIDSNEIIAVVIAAILSMVGWIIIRVYIGQGKIAWAFSHQHAFYLSHLNPPVLAYTKEIWIQNIGRSIAEDVEIVFVFRPEHFEVWPQRHYEVLTNPENNLTIKMDTLNSREFVTISLFQTAMEPPVVTSVRWCGGQGKLVQMGPQQIRPRWFIMLLTALLLLGFFSFWYFLFRIVGHLL